MTEPGPSDAAATAPAAGAAAAATTAAAQNSPLLQVVADDTRESFRSWRRIARLWALAWHFALGVSVVLVLVGHQPLWLLVPLAGMSASYLLLSYPWQMNRVGYRAALFHLAIASVLSFTVVWADPSLVFLSSVVLSQFTPLTGFRFRGIALLTAAAAVLTLPIALRDGIDGGSLLGWALTAGSALLFNLFIGGFFVEMLNDNDRRGALIRELEATRAELERVNHEAGAREERERLAREIHDTLAQGFTSLLMLVQAAEATLDTDPATTRERLELAARTARENLAEARALIGGDPTAGLPLHTAIKRAAVRLHEELGITTSVAVEGHAQPLSAGRQVVTLRVAQEALANVRKHARAGSVAVRLDYGADRLVLTVEDDGVGLNAAASPDSGADPSVDAQGGAGFGLRSMRERLAEVGGTVSVTGAVGAGTRVEAEVPYE
ncbi:MAG: sensor histidine kinase [Catenulispora sp.]|nr:sensor histidine kinase [Catenulispora sp.]